LALTTKHHRPISTRLRRYARGMRRTSTSAEEAMWRLLRARALSGYKFRRQAPVENFILDFVCFERRVVVEIDGSQHADSLRDTARDKQLRDAGFETIRYWNNDVLLRPAAMLEDLLARLTSLQRNPSPGASLRSAPPSPARGEGKRARGEG
jgi:very-short-patch-repair endonuclease